MTIHIIKRFALPLILAVLILGVGTLAYAKENGNQDKSDKKVQVEKNKAERKQDKKEIKLCFRAFGHLIAPGFIKHHGEVDVDLSNCFIPFGIAKKFRGVASSTTQDLIAPTITDVKIVTTTNKATITWHTSERADTTLFWNTSAGVNVSSTSTPKIANATETKDHKVVIPNLTASTTYYFVLRSKDHSGNATTSSEMSFTTKGAPVDTAAPTISSIVILTSSSTATVGWHTSENATSKVYFGTLDALNVNATTTSFVETNALTENHSLQVTSLASSTPYFFAVESKDATGNRTVSPIFTATTLGL